LSGLADDVSAHAFSPFDVAVSDSVLAKQINMSDRTLRFLVATVISLLLIHQIGTLIFGIFGMAWGLASSIVVAAVSFFSIRLAKAGGKSSFWFLLPTLLFTVAPAVVTIWRAFANEAGWLERFASITPFLVGFGLPIIILLFVYVELRKRTLNC